MRFGATSALPGVTLLTLTTKKPPAWGAAPIWLCPVRSENSILSTGETGPCAVAIWIRRALIGRAAGIGPRRAVGRDQRSRCHRQLGRTDGFGEVGAAVERVLNPVDQLLDRALALVLVELGRDLGLGLLERLAAAGLHRVDLHHDPAEVGVDRTDDRALGGS